MQAGGWSCIDPDDYLPPASPSLHEWRPRLRTSSIGCAGADSVPRSALYQKPVSLKIPALDETRAKWERDRSYQASKYGGSLVRPRPVVSSIFDGQESTGGFLCQMEKFSLKPSCDESYEVCLYLLSFPPVPGKGRSYQTDAPCASKPASNELALLWRCRRALSTALLALFHWSLCIFMRDSPQTCGMKPTTNIISLSQNAEIKHIGIFLGDMMGFGSSKFGDSCT